LLKTSNFFGRDSYSITNFTYEFTLKEGPKIKMENFIETKCWRKFLEGLKWKVDIFIRIKNILTLKFIYKNNARNCIANWKFNSASSTFIFIFFTEVSSTLLLSETVVFAKWDVWNGTKLQEMLFWAAHRLVDSGQELLNTSRRLLKNLANLSIIIFNRAKSIQIYDRCTFLNRSVTPDRLLIS